MTLIQITKSPYAPRAPWSGVAAVRIGTVVFCLVVWSAAIAALV